MSKKKKYVLTALAVALAGWLVCLPRDLFKGVSYSTVVESTEGELLGARVADDGQWRFPPCDSVPARYAKALILFEDRHFYHHPGINPVALGRALRQNLKAGHIVSGGSTITMQVIRLSRTSGSHSPGRKRTVWQKAIEAVQATRLECTCSKDKILALYASHAPFGGNVVGLEAASWRYFGRPARVLTWAEAATLAVLPNAPASMHPGRNRGALKSKRDRLLRRLMEQGEIDSLTYTSAIEEPLPQEPLPLPGLASHYVAHCPHGERTRTTLRYNLQTAVEEALSRRSDELSREGVADMAAVVMDNTSGTIIAYVGNTSPGRIRPGMQVDIATAPRSTGSILKPFLYEAAVEEGVILPKTLLPDIPMNLGGFAPQNFDRQFYGAVPAHQALARSLNVPAVFLLRQYGVAKFHHRLLSYGLTTLEHDPSWYGLSLILGGAEARLDQITAAYSQMARKACTAPTPSICYTLKALEEVNRPDELDWRLIKSVRKAAWKTGTSYGLRDAWAVGMTPRYTIGVWAGNAQGQGAAGLTGARAAGPALFGLLNLLPKDQDWFPSPSDLSQGVVWVATCLQSGHLAGPGCTETEMLPIPQAGLDTDPCPYHGSGTFTLPPAMEWFYKPHHPSYIGATSSQDSSPIEFIYPSSGSTLSLPRQLDSSLEGAVFRVAHHNPGATLWWHLDNTYVGETRLVHEMKLLPAPGKHRLTVVDGEGNSASVRFTIASSL